MSSGRDHWRYALTAYRSLPVTFVRRVVFGRDPYWRQFFWSRWGYLPPDLRRAAGKGPVLLVDVLSGGEVTQLVTFCRSLRRTLPDWVTVLSTPNRYSFDFAKANLDVDFVIDAPWDLRGPIRRALRSMNPAALVCVQNVTSPVLVREAKRRGATTLLVSGLMSNNVHLHPMYRRTLHWKSFGDLDFIGARSEEDAREFVAQGARPGRVTVSGNMKFDFEYLEVPEHVREKFQETLQLNPEEPVLLGASLHPGEEKLVADAYLEARRAEPSLRLVLVPRYNAYVPQVVAQLQKRGLDVIRRSALPASTRIAGRVVVVDTFGELGRLYSIASVVFLGGSTYRRHVLGLGQNPVEPLVHRRPVFFGPFMNLWVEITTALKGVWPRMEVTTAKELAAGVVAVLQDDGLRARLTEKIDGILSVHRDDVARNVELVCQVLGQRRRGGPARTVPCHPER